MKHVYAMQRPDGAIKIGISKNPEKRKVEVSAAIQQQVSLMFTLPIREDARRIEDVSHKLLQSKHDAGEWFLVSVEEAMQSISHAVAIVEGRAPDTTAKLPSISGPGKRTEFPESIFVRMPPGTKDLMERLSGSSPTPSAWVRQLFLDQFKREEEERGIVPPAR